MLAAQAIKAGDRRVIVAGGQESMSNAPYYVFGMRNGVKLGDQSMVDGMVKDGLWCSFCDVHMGSHAEYTAKKAQVTRAMQDEFAAKSHQKAVAAMEAGKFRDEIVPVQIPGKKGPTTIDADEGPRKDTTAESLGKLRPAFGGAEKVADLSVTAGNWRRASTMAVRRSWSRPRSMPARTVSRSLDVSPATRPGLVSRRICSLRRSLPYAI